MAKQEYGIDVETAVNELHEAVETAVNFITSEYEEDWIKAEKYYRGETDLPLFTGRSQVVKTEVRDVIRGMRPDVMRVLLHANKIVSYKPTQVANGAWADLQSRYATQLFWRSDGYRLAMSLYDNAAKLKYAPVKVLWNAQPNPRYFEHFNILAEELAQWELMDGIEIVSVEETPSDEEADDEIVTYTVVGYVHEEKGSIKLAAVPPYEFFIDRNSDSIDDAIVRGVHGHRRSVTVEEAIELDLEYDDWRSLDNEDPEQSDHVESSYQRRQYQKDHGPEQDSDDILKYEFLLTEVYARYDLTGSGRAQLYCFWLGGTGYTYLGHEEVEDSPMALALIDPVPHNAAGLSLAEIVIPEQDLGTSILRGVADNFHASNNPRPVGDPNRVDFDDLMNNVIGAPIKTRGDYPVQFSSVPFTGSAGIPLMDKLEQGVQEKTGMTKAAQGLDPDAMQSTDKDAVMNTIQQGAGQKELIIRNLVHTGFIPVFSKMLRLMQKYGDPQQYVELYGQYLPFPSKLLNADMYAEPAVGLGTGSPQERQATLQFIMGTQKELMAEHGLDNPIVSTQQIYNTIEDMCTLGGISDVSRYFTAVDENIEAMMAQQRAEAAKAAAENQPPNPIEAMKEIENNKLKIEDKKLMINHRERNIELAQKSIAEAERLDLERDKMVQTRQLKVADLKSKALNETIKEEQAQNATIQQQLPGPQGGPTSG